MLLISSFIRLAIDILSSFIKIYEFNNETVVAGQWGASSAIRRHFCLHGTKLHVRDDSDVSRMKAVGDMQYYTNSISVKNIRSHGTKNDMMIMW